MGNVGKRRKSHKKRRRKSPNPVAVSFAVALLTTLTIGAIFLAYSVEKNKEEERMLAFNSSEEESVFTTRVPFAERILSENTGELDTAVTGEAVNDNGQNGASENVSVGGDEGKTTAEALDTSGDGGEDAAEIETENVADENIEEIAANGESANGAVTDSYWYRSITSAVEDRVTLAFAGDILLDSGYAIMNRIGQNGGTIDGVIGASLLNYMRSADVMVINNEFPYSDGGTPTEGKTFTFHAASSSAQYLNQMGADVVTLANNHTYDYGEQGLLNTLSAIDNVGVVRIGAGTNIEEASHPVYYTAGNGIKVAIIAATEIERLDNPDTKGATDTSPGVFRCLDITRLQQRIREAKNTGAFVIVYIHWGTESQEEIDWWQQKQGPEIAEAGADLIVGAHPHVLQKIDYINGIPVIYSLGNYLFNSKTVDTALLRVAVKSDMTSELQIVPALQSGCTVNEATGEDASRILGHLREISGGVSIDENGYIISK